MNKNKNVYIGHQPGDPLEIFHSLLDNKLFKNLIGYLSLSYLRWIAIDFNSQLGSRNNVSDTELMVKRILKKTSEDFSL